MPLYKVSLRFATDNTWARRTKWSNSFYLNRPTAGEASQVMVAAWQTSLRGTVRNTVFAYEVYSSSVLEGDVTYDVRTITAGNQRGGLSTVDLGQQYQQNSCLSVTMPVTGSRPSRKFWRPGLYENDVTNGEIVNPVLVETVALGFDELLSEFGDTFLLDPDGQTLTGPVRVRFTQRKLGRQAGLNLPSPPANG